MFDGPIKEDIGLRMEGLQYESDPFFFDFYQDPLRFGKEKDKKILNAEGYALSAVRTRINTQDHFQLHRDHFMEPIALEDISNQVYDTTVFLSIFKKAPTRPLLSSTNMDQPRHQIAFRNRCRHQNDLL